MLTTLLASGLVVRRVPPPYMGGGIKQLRPTTPFDPTTVQAAINSLPKDAEVPKLVVFDVRKIELRKPSTQSHA